MLSVLNVQDVEIDVVPYPTGGGDRFAGKSPGLAESLTFLAEPFVRCTSMHWRRAQSAAMTTLLQSSCTLLQSLNRCGCLGICLPAVND